MLFLSACIKYNVSVKPSLKDRLFLLNLCDPAFFRNLCIYIRTCTCIFYTLRCLWLAGTLSADISCIEVFFLSATSVLPASELFDAGARSSLRQVHIHITQ